MEQTMTLLHQPERLFELVSDGVMVRTMEGKINAWSRGASELYGWKETEVIGRISHELLQTQFSAPLAEIESEVVRNGHWEGKLVHTTRDGDRVVVKSRWVLDLERQSGAIVEVNVRAADHDIDNTMASTKANRILTKIANIVLAGGALVCILTLFFFLYQYAWTEQRQFTTPMSGALYYVLPTALAGFLINSLRFKAASKVNIVLLCISLASTAYATELFLGLFGLGVSGPAKPVMTRLAESTDKQKDAAALTKKFGIVVDARSPGEVIADLGKKGVDAVPVVTPSNNLFIKQPDGSIKSALKINGREVMPLAGVASKVTVLCNEDGRWIDYRSDERGFNNPAEIWRSKRMEIAALGDSFVHGYCVPADKNLVARIRESYPATLNLGVAGDGPLLMLAKINEYLDSMKPPVVLWFYYEGNDLTDLQTERKSVLLTNYLRERFTQSELARQTAVDRAIMDDIPRLRAIEQGDSVRRQANRVRVVDNLVEFAKLSTLRQRLALVGGEDAGTSAARADLEGANMKVFRNILSQAKMRVNAWGGRLYFVYLPEWARYGHYNSWGETKRDYVMTMVKSLGISTVDIDAAFQAHGDPLSLFPFRELGHYNENGHRLVAEEVLKMLSQRAAR